MKKVMLMTLALTLVCLGTAGVVSAQALKTTYSLDWYVNLGRGAWCDRSITTNGQVTGAHTTSFGRLNNGIWDTQSVDESLCTKFTIQATCYHYQCKPITNGSQCGWWTDAMAPKEVSPCHDLKIWLGNNGNMWIETSNK